LGDLRERAVAYKGGGILRLQTPKAQALGLERESVSGCHGFFTSETVKMPAWREARATVLGTVRVDRLIRDADLKAQDRRKKRDVPVAILKPTARKTRGDADSRNKRARRKRS
jgi:hypothetical protein